MHVASGVVPAAGIGRIRRRRGGGSGGGGGDGGLVYPKGVYCVYSLSYRDRLSAFRFFHSVFSTRLAGGMSVYCCMCAPRKMRVQLLVIFFPPESARMSFVALALGNGILRRGGGGSGSYLPACRTGTAYGL